MNTKHTPGPWHIGSEQDYSVDRYKRNAEWARIRNASGGLIAAVASVHPQGCRKSTDFDTEAANARLIASAPDLLSALEDVELRATQARLASAIGKKSGVKQADFLRGELDRIGQAARAAITKAQEMKTP